MISPLKPILTFFGVKDGKIEATALKRIADSLNNLINTYVAWADTVGQDYSISNFIKWLKNSQGEIVATELRMYALKAATLALNMVFAMFASWAISAGMNAFINWMKNAKTHSEQLISTMEDAHDAAEEAQQDVDDIQQKLDDLDQKVKDIGAEKIEDIVDPQEKAKIQEINNLLETQLRLKKQIADDENNKANKAASDVFNDKSEVVVSNETPTSYAEADPNGIGVTVTQSKNVTRTEALREHTARVNELSDAYVKLMSDENATDEERAQAKKNLEDEISLTNDAGTKVSELADMYETDASKYGDVSAEVQECTDSMQGASDALERANNLLNGTTSVENTNLDAFKSKFKDVIEEIDNGYLSMQEAIAQYKDLSPLQAFGSMTGEAIINIDSDTAHQTEAEATALAKLHEIADANNISFEDLIGAFEQLGIVATSNTDDVSNYASQDLADKKREWNKKDAEKAIDDQIKKYNEFKDKLSEVMDDIGKSWKNYQKELEYTAQIQKMTITQMEGSLDGYHNKIVASLNTGSVITGIQNLITNLESLINTLTKVNNLYSAIKTGKYEDLGTKGLWNTIKGFFNKGGEEAAAESGKTVETFFEKLSSKVQTSGNGLIEKVGGVWKAIKAGAHETFSGSGGGIVSTVIDGFKAIGGAVSKSKVGSALIKGAGKLVAGAGGLIKGAVGAIGAAGASAIPVVGAVAATAGLAIYGTAKNYKHQKEIWSNKEDGFGKKAIKSVATFIWDTSPIGAVVNLCKDIFGKSKETAENTKDTANSSSETAENTKKATGVTNLTINATQGTISEENKTEPVEEKKQSKWDKFWGSKFWFWNWGKKASGDKKIKHGGTYNVDEAGPEMLVRQPASGRYTYLETGDGVVPADITSRLFEMGGNPDKWFSDQLAKNGSASMVQSRSSGGISLSIGDVNVNNPVGDSDALASELVNRLPNRIVQQLNKR